MNLKTYINKTGKLTSVDVEKKYRCDSCKKSFKAGSVLLKPEPKNISITPPMWMGGILIAEYKGGKYHLHCPKCGAVHLFGFNPE